VARHKDTVWTLADRMPGWDGAQLAVLMDIRDELKVLNRIIGCGNAIDIPNILRRIDANTKKKTNRKK